MFKPPKWLFWKEETGIYTYDKPVKQSNFYKINIFFVTITNEILISASWVSCAAAFWAQNFLI